MKQTLLQFSIFFFASMLAFQAQGQVTITKDDYPRPMTFIDSIYKSTSTSPALPTIGADQVWDYSGLVKEEIIERQHLDASADVNFSGALNLKINDLTFQGFLIISDSYEAIDNAGWYELGRYIYGGSNSITAITGGADDKLDFPEDSRIFSGRINYLNFPVAYGGQWTQSRQEDLDYKLTVAAYGLSNTPGQRKRYITDVRSVVGHGDLTLPYGNGTPTVAMDVLLIKSVETTIDSFFLGGAPAPEALLNAFGLVQNTTTIKTSYIFYKPDFGAPVMSIEEGDTRAFYRPQAAATVSATHDLNLSAINYFPNPVSAGAEMTISMEKPIASGYVSFTDLAGRQVFQTAFESAGNQFQIDIPATTGKGLYFYHVLDKKGVPVGLGKLQVN